MKILVYENRKQDPQYWDAATPEKENAAFEKLYRLLRDDWQCYGDLAEALAKPPQEPEPPFTELTLKLPTWLLRQIQESAKAQADGAKREVTVEKVVTDALQRQWPKEWEADASQLKLYVRAEAGDVAAMKKLVGLRRGYEYEGWRLADVEAT